MRYHLINAAAIIGIISTLTLSTFAIKGIFPFGDRLLAWGDMSAQGIPFLYAQWDFFRHIAVSTVEWHILGGLPSWNLPTLIAPFNLPILLSERHNILQSVSLLILFKMICMALSMYVFTNRFDVPRQYKILAAVLYGSGSCAIIYYQIEYVMFDSAILFPILMLGFYRLLERGKPLLYIVMLTLTVAHSFYVGAMICTFMFFASVAIFYSTSLRAEFWSKCRLLILSTVAALGMSAMFFMPSVLSLNESDRFNAGIEGGALATYIRAIGALHIFDTQYVFDLLCWSLAFLSAACLPIAVISYSWKNLRLYHRLLFGIIMLAVFVPGTELLMHGGSHQQWPVRFVFILNFVLLEIFLAALESNPSILDNKLLKPNFLPLITQIAFVVLGVNLCRDAGNSDLALFIVVAGVVAAFLFFYGFNLRRTNRWFIFAALVTLEIFLMQYFWFAPNFANLELLPDHYNKYILNASDLALEIDQYKGNPLERTRDINNDFENNYAYVTETYALCAFHGGMSHQTKKTFRALGYSCSDRQSVFDTGGSLFTDALLNVRHSFTVKDARNPDLFDEDHSIKTVLWFNHRITLPLGLTVAHDVDIDKNTFDVQNNIFNAIIGREVELITQYPINVVDDKILINVVGRRELYLFGESQADESEPNKKKHFSLKVNGNEFVIPDNDETDNRIYPAKHNNNLIDLGAFDNQTVEIEFTTEDGYDFDGVHIGGLDIDLLRAECDALNEKNSVEIVRIDNNSIEIRRDAPDGGTIFLPIPFDVGWHCFIDGIETPTKKIFGGFIGFDAPKGNCVIELKFSTPNIQRGAGLSVVGLILALVVLRRKNFGSMFDRPLGIFYLALAVILSIAFYIIPFIAFFLPLA